MVSNRLSARVGALAAHDQPVPWGQASRLTWSVLKRLFVARFVDGDDYMEANPDLRTEIQAATASCESLDE